MMIGSGDAMLVGRDCFLVRMLRLLVRFIGEVSWLFSFAFEHHGRYDKHDMHRIISVFFCVSSLHGYDIYDDRSYEFGCCMSVSEHCIHSILLLVRFNEPWAFLCLYRDIIERI